MDWFFSSLAERPIKGLAFFALSLVGLEQRQSYPLRIEFAQPLNVVILLKTHLKTQQQGHVILFSSDLHLPHD